MEAIYSKIKDMLKAYYPVLYLTSYEYDRTKQKIEGIVNILRSENKNLRLFNWNCVDGLRLIDGITPSPILNKDGEEIVEPEETLKYILEPIVGNVSNAQEAEGGVYNWLKSVGVPNKLKDEGFSEANIANLVDLAFTTPSLDGLLSIAPTKATKAVVEEIYRNSL